MSDLDSRLEFPASSARLTTLSNGLELIVKEDHSAPVVSLQAWCRAGSIHEGDWLGAGMSHYLEHMLFKGTERRDANEIAQTVQSQGGYINAYTSFDRTVYWIDAPADGSEICLDVLCDVVGFAQLPENEFESERDVIRREIAMGEDSPDQVLSKALFRTAYASHPCRYPVIGHLDLFNQLSRDDLYGYYREKYSPDNLFLVVVGDVEEKIIIEQVESLLGGLERRRRSPVLVPEEPRQVGIRSEAISFPTDLFRGRLAWPIPDARHPDVPAIDLMAGILGDGRSSRLYRNVREEQQLAHSVGAYPYTPSFPGQFIINYDTEFEKAPAAKEAVFNEIERFRDEGCSEEELKKVKNQTLSSQLSTLTDMRGQASDLGSNWLLTRNLDYTRDYVQQVQEVTVEDIQRVTGSLREDCYTQVSMTPAEAGGPAEKPLRPKRSEDIRKVTLENGLTVLLLSDKRVPFVQSTGVFRGGLLAETPEKNGVAKLMARLLTKDTANYSAETIASLIESVGGGIGGTIGNNTFGVSAGAMTPDLELVVELLGETILRPAFLEETLEKEKQFQIAQIKAEADRPFTVAMKALKEGLYGGHPYGLRASGSPESVEALGRTDVQALHGNLVQGNNGVLGVFGDLELDRAEDLIRGQFGSTLAQGERAFSESTADRMPEQLGVIKELTHEKEQAIFLAGFRTVDLRHPDNPALEMIDEACSDMASRLFIRIREELGLAYSVGATRLAGLEPGFIVFYASTAPEKLDLVQEEMLSEIDLMVKEGLDQAEFDRARASWLGRELIQLQGAKELASTAAIDELVGLGWDNYRKTPETVRGLTRDHVREVAGKYLHEENRVIVRLTN